jgi:hypothetical protein
MRDWIYKPVTHETHIKTLCECPDCGREFTLWFDRHEARDAYDRDNGKVSTLCTACIDEWTDDSSEEESFPQEVTNDTEPTRDNGFFVNLRVGDHTDWETNWRPDCSSFVVVTYQSGLPFTSATVIVNDPVEGWFIDGEYALQEHEVAQNYQRAHYYFGIEGVLDQWLATLRFKLVDEFPNGFDIYGVKMLLHLDEGASDGLFYILPDKTVCDRCAAAPGVITHEMFENGDVSACWSNDPWDHQECDHCGVVFDAKERTYHPQPPHAGE